MKTHKEAKIRRKIKVSSRIKGIAGKPRLSIFRSNKNIYVQAVDDILGKTLFSMTSVNNVDKKGKNKVDISFEIGKVFGESLKKKKIEQAVFDRGYYKYHGRVKAVADGIRSSGVKI